MKGVNNEKYIKKSTIVLFAYKFKAYDENMPDMILHSPDINLENMTVSNDIDGRCLGFKEGDYLVYDDVLDSFYPVPCETFEYIYGELAS